MFENLDMRASDARAWTDRGVEVGVVTKEQAAEINAIKDPDQRKDAALVVLDEVVKKRELSIPTIRF